MPTMKILLVIALSILIASIVITTACHAEPATKDSGGGGFQFGVNLLDVEELNTRLTKKGFEALDDVMFSFGGTGYKLIKERILLGGEGAGFFQAVSRGTQTATFGGGYGFFDLGYSELLNIPINAASNRLKDLYDMKLVTREERILTSTGGRQFVYRCVFC